MAWIYLILAGLLEVGWALGLKYTDGFTKVLPSVLTIAGMIGSFVLLGQALRVLPIGTALPSGRASARWGLLCWA